MSDHNGVELPPLAERRPSTRKRVLFRGVAVDPFRRNGAACQVRDISQTGARITVSPITNLPDQLHLIIVRAELAYQARVIWRRGEEVGLAFVKMIDLRLPADPSLSHLVQILSQQKGSFLSWG